uniref:Proteasome alpha-type subunits domain-containing protein n=1 Tax=Vitrella brassicaformis TaxID=1169539 RepID=A0A7S1P746_9ALVE|mmetsp:Transcript_38262/g.95818  ORF Transcript_38262/g.95818 Transcript_38262/m.95818 type:complete len:253 (+) Transcript_38262:148-906(+)
MAGMGAGYDLSVGTYSPDGRVFQVEYAAKAVDNSGTAIGLCCKDGVVLGVEKLLASKMLVPGTNKRIYAIDKHIGMAVAGLVADARQLVKLAREQAEEWKQRWGEPISGMCLSERIAAYVHAYTLNWVYRPHGASILIGSLNPEDGSAPCLYCVEPSGSCSKYFGYALGKGKQAAKTEIEKIKPSELTCQEALFHAAKILHQVHDENKDKEYELEVTWICPQSDFIHQQVPPELLQEAEERAKKALEEAEED